MITALLFAVQARIASPTHISHEPYSYTIANADSLRAGGAMWPEGDNVPGALVAGYDRLEGLVGSSPEGD